MTLPLNFPTIYEVTSFVIPLGSPNNDQAVICELAKRVSHFYSNLLTEQGHQQRSSTLRFYFYPPVFPPKDLVEKFQRLVEEVIIKKLSDDEYNQRSCFFRVDSGVPEAEVGEALYASGICPSEYSIVYLFPHRSFTHIAYNRKKRTIRLRIA